MLFEQSDGFKVSLFFTAGYPQLADTLTLLSAVDFPFSDPLADGPVIQQSSQQSIANGMTLQRLFEQLKEVRGHISLPLILMGYLNPVVQFGLDRFL